MMAISKVATAARQRRRWWSSSPMIVSSSASASSAVTTTFLLQSPLFLFTLCLLQLQLCQGSLITANITTTTTTTELPLPSPALPSPVFPSSFSSSSSSSHNLTHSSSNQTLINSTLITPSSSARPSSPSSPSPPLDDFQTAAINVYISPGNESNHTFQPDRALLQQGPLRTNLFIGEPHQAVLAKPLFINFTRLLMHRSSMQQTTTPSSSRTSLRTSKTPTIQRKYIFIDKTTTTSATRAAKTTADWSRRQSSSTILPTLSKNKTLVKVKVVEGDEPVLLLDQTTSSTTSLPTSPTGLSRLSPTTAEAILENIIRSQRQSDGSQLLDPVSKTPLLNAQNSLSRTKSPKRGGSRTTTTMITTVAPTTTTTVPTTTARLSSETTTTNNSMAFESTITTTTSATITTITSPQDGGNNGSNKVTITTTSSPMPTLNFNPTNAKNLQNEEFIAEVSTMATITSVEALNNGSRSGGGDFESKVDTEPFGSSSSTVPPPTTLLSPQTLRGRPEGSTTSTTASSSSSSNHSTVTSWRQCHFKLLHLCPQLAIARFAAIRSKIACYGEGLISCDPRAGKLCRLTPTTPSSDSLGAAPGSSSYESYEEASAENGSTNNKEEPPSPSTSASPFFCNVPLTTEYCSGSARCVMPKSEASGVITPSSVTPTTPITTTTITPGDQEGMDTTARTTTTTNTSLSDDAAKQEVTTLLAAEQHLLKLQSGGGGGGDHQLPSSQNYSHEEVINNPEQSSRAAKPLSPLKIGLISALIAIGSLIVILVTIVAYISWSKLKNGGKQQVSPSGGNNGHQPISSFWSASTTTTSPRTAVANGNASNGAERPTVAKTTMANEATASAPAPEAAN